jgi:hypothetical protein
LFSKSLDAITAEHINALIEGGEPEKKTLEYKRKLPDNGRDDKNELRCDVASLANTAGGDLIFGIDEGEDGLELIGIGDANGDAAILHVENVLHEKIEPRIPGLTSHVVDAGGGKRVLIVRVPRSWRGPHMVKINEACRTPGRKTNGKYTMDASEIRQAIMASEELPQRIRRWRRERLDLIRRDEGPVPLQKGVTFVLHMVPVETLDDAMRVTAVELKKQLTTGVIQTPRVFAHGTRINLDGAIQSGNERSPSDEKQRSTYCQLFRSTAVEWVWVEVMDPVDQMSWAYENDVLQALGQGMRTLTGLGIRPPIMVSLSVLGAKGVALCSDQRRRIFPAKIDREDLVLPELLFEQWPNNFFASMRDTFDCVWNACGQERSYNYDKDGTWIAGPVEGLPNP